MSRDTEVITTIWDRPLTPIQVSCHVRCTSRKLLYDYYLLTSQTVQLTISNLLHTPLEFSFHAFRSGNDFLFYIPSYVYYYIEHKNRILVPCGSYNSLVNRIHWPHILYCVDVCSDCEWDKSVSPSSLLLFYAYMETFKM